LADFSGKAHGPGPVANFIDNTFYAIDVLFNFFDGTEREQLSFVGMAEFTLIPRAIPRHPEQEALSLAGRADRSYLKIIVHIAPLNINYHGFVLLSMFPLAFVPLGFGTGLLDSLDFALLS